MKTLKNIMVLLGLLLALIALGQIDQKGVKHLIDGDAGPQRLEGWTIEEHQRNGIIKLDSAKIQLYLCDEQNNSAGLTGEKLRQKLFGQKVLNAAVLDYLLENPEIIPASWKKVDVFFWGTIYRPPCGMAHIRYLFWTGKQWDWNFFWINNDFSKSQPAAILK
jgi:hypothetical protein